MVIMLIRYEQMNNEGYEINITDGASTLQVLALQGLNPTASRSAEPSMGCCPAKHRAQGDRDRGRVLTYWFLTVSRIDEALLLKLEHRRICLSIPEGVKSALSAVVIFLSGSLLSSSVKEVDPLPFKTPEVGIFAGHICSAMFNIECPLLIRLSQDWANQKVISASGTGISNPRVAQCDMNDCYSRLRRLVPTIPPNKKVSKVEILQHSARIGSNNPKRGSRMMSRETRPPPAQTRTRKIPKVTPGTWPPPRSCTVSGKKNPGLRKVLFRPQDLDGRILRMLCPSHPFSPPLLAGLKHAFYASAMTKQFSPLFHSTCPEPLRNPNLQIGIQSGPVPPIGNFLSSGSAGNVKENRLLPLPASLTRCGTYQVGSDRTRLEGRGENTLIKNNTKNCCHLSFKIPAVVWRTRRQPQRRAQNNQEARSKIRFSKPCASWADWQPTVMTVGGTEFDVQFPTKKFWTGENCDPYGYPIQSPGNIPLRKHGD
ncbi:hypothetical protein PANDA_015463 [Ailuropoda melanoleuca]|uniref:DNA-binding protein inhibitor ID-4 n=1 Tax=Ailuropoda melanoleuca TaxID=9646 RepID=D2HTG4_AILME|nr:hypothetical protein PANDA_015463 [Ailuropoda melanoleuca]